MQVTAGIKQIRFLALRFIFIGLCVDFFDHKCGEENTHVDLNWFHSYLNTPRPFLDSIYYRLPVGLPVLVWCLIKL